jgi:hypothetical protein
MINPAFLFAQLTQALSCIQRVLADLQHDVDHAEANQPHDVPLCTRPPAGWTCSRNAGHSGPCAAIPIEAAPPAGGPDPLARSMALAMTIQKQVDQGRVIVALTERLDNLTRILLDIAPDACAKHDLFGF